MGPLGVAEPERNDCRTREQWGVPHGSAQIRRPLVRGRGGVAPGGVPAAAPAAINSGLIPASLGLRRTRPWRCCAPGNLAFRAVKSRQDEFAMLDVHGRRACRPAQ